MSIESQPPFFKTAGEPEEEKASFEEMPEEPEINKRTREGLNMIYEKFEDSKERTARIMELIEPFLRHIDKKIITDEEIEKIRNDLKNSASVPDKNRFLEMTMQGLDPFFKIKEAHPKEFENAQAKVMNEKGGFTEINRLLSYGYGGSGETIHIHAPFGKTVENKIKLYRDGMKELAEIVNNNPKIRKITAASSLIAEHSGLFTKMGFIIESVPDDLKIGDFAGEGKEVKIATIDREEFLKRFLK